LQQAAETFAVGDLTFKIGVKYLWFLILNHL
jgi:hypothetical protein